jgi:hypothetical protein
MKTLWICKLLLSLIALFIVGRPGWAQTTSTDQANNYYLTGNYIAVLGRMPDDSGWMYWISLLHNVTLTQQQVTQYFLTSTEYCDDMGTCSPSQSAFLNQLFQNAYSRQPTQAEMGSWLVQMNSGTTMAQVVSAIVATQEFATDHGSGSAAPNASSFCTGYENGIAFNAGNGVTAGTEVPFTATYTNYCGNSDLQGGSILVDDKPSDTTSIAGGCYIEWDPAGDVWLFGSNYSDIAEGNLSTGGVLNI